MKSIKEKAEEYAPYTKDDFWYRIRAAINAQISYEAGANYVLEEIEKLTNSQNWCAFPKQSRKELKELIEQLKK